MDLREKTLSETYKHNGRIINLRIDEVKLPNGKTSIREVIEHNGGVSVAAITKNKEIYLVEQYRHPNSHIILETPAGKLEKGEDPLEAGKRELSEEVGITAKKYYDLGKFFPTPAYCSEIIYLYAATELSESSQNLDEDEFLNIKRYSVDEALQMILDNKISDGKTQALILKVAKLIENGTIKI